MYLQIIEKSGLKTLIAIDEIAHVSYTKDKDLIHIRYRHTDDHPYESYSIRNCEEAYERIKSCILAATGSDCYTIKGE